MKTYITFWYWFRYPLFVEGGGGAVNTFHYVLTTKSWPNTCWVGSSCHSAVQASCIGHVIHASDHFQKHVNGNRMVKMCTNYCKPYGEFGNSCVLIFFVSINGRNIVDMFTIWLPTNVCISAIFHGARARYYLERKYNLSLKKFFWRENELFVTKKKQHFIILPIWI